MCQISYGILSKKQLLRASCYTHWAQPSEPRTTVFFLRYRRVGRYRVGLYRVNQSVLN